MNYQELLKKISAYVVQFFLEHPHEHLYYHNLAHTVKILEAANKINAHYNLDDKDYFIVSAAIWFHDAGILTGGLQDHEIKSAEIAENFLIQSGISQQEITEIKNCILSTKLPQQPHSLIEKIVCDADLFNLGTTEFTENNKLVRKENEEFGHAKISSHEWRARTIALLESHHYHTEFCQLLLNKTKEANLKNLLKKQEEKNWQKHPANLALSKTGDPEKTKTSGRLKLKNVSSHHLRGVETMFRNSSSNHQRLSVMGDNKAFIMISVNSIIISVALGLIIGKFVLNHKLIIPTILLLSVNVIAIIYSVLATRPRIMSGTFTKKDVETKKVNLLFFGSFYKMPLEDFEYGIRQMMDDSEFLYGSLIKDIYWQGKVLGRKFRLLRISYDIFMYGTALSVIAYILSSLF
ncbi:MAG TPA: Pycsar system effector family protein [Puia sp.]|jgi:predicted metal-dependent HD superfamily phosphohydrolase|nr:Pycsar system effector family protein [Puia sp.]